MTKRDTVNAAMALLFALFASASARADLFDEAVGWYCGGTDLDGDGVFTNGELRDRRHAGLPDKASNNVTVWPSTGTDARHAIAWTKETVECAVGGKTLENQDCIELRQMCSDGGANLRDQGGYLQFPIISDALSDRNVISNAEFTVILRFKISGERKLVDGTDIGTDTTPPNYEYILGIGDYGSNTSGRGLKVGLRRSNGRITYSCPVTTLDNYHWEANSNIIVTNGTYTAFDSTWNELAVVSYWNGETPRLKFYLYQPGLTVKTHDIPNLHCLPVIPSSVILGGALTRNRSDLEYYKLGFRGKVHLFAVWNKALSQSQIEDAFKTLSVNGKDKKSSIFKLGNDTYGEELFAGSNEGIAAISAQAPYETVVPSNFVAGTELDITVPLTQYQRGMKQAFRIKSAADSARGMFSLCVGDDVIDTVEIGANRTRHVLIPESYFTSDSVLLKLKCLSAGAGGVKLSTIELCGSWQYGIKDKSNAEFSGGARQQSFYVGEYDILQFPYYTALDKNKNANIYFYVPAGMEKSYVYEFSTSIYAGELNPTLRFSINGSDAIAEKAWLSPNRQLNEDVVIKITPDLIVPGTNCLSWTNVGTNGVTSTGETYWNWGRIDYCSFVIRNATQRGHAILVR